MVTWRLNIRLSCYRTPDLFVLSRSDYFLDNLDGYFPAEEAEKQLATATDWGRYAELFEYDVNEGRLTLTMDE